MVHTRNLNLGRVSFEYSKSAGTNKAKPSLPNSRESETRSQDIAAEKCYEERVLGSCHGFRLNCNAPTDPAKICLKPSPNNQYTLTTDNSVASNQTFCLTILNTAINTSYHVTNDSVPVLGVCPYTLTVIAGANGTVTGGGSYDSGTTQTITATPNIAYLFSSWTGSSGCSGTASHSITMDANKTCTANFTLSPSWYNGIASTVLAGKYVEKADRSYYYYKTTSTTVTSPQGIIGLDPNYPTKISLVSPQANPAVDFSAYPAQNACKAIGGRLPNIQEWFAIYAGRLSYGNNFDMGDWYWSSTEYDGNSAYLFDFSTSTVYHDTKSVDRPVRCVAG